LVRVWKQGHVVLVSARFPSANATLHGGNRSRPDPVCNACRRLCSTLPTKVVE
jgi:hypothetical protein